MRKMWPAVLLLAFFAFTALSWGAESQVNMAEVEGRDSEAGLAVARLALADQLVELGRQQKSPILLASAAQILGGIGTPTEVKREKREEALPEKQESPSKKIVTDKESTPESLYAEAIALAKEKEDAALAGVLENQSRVGATKGAGSGAIRHYDRIQGYTNDIYTISFRGGEKAWVRVRGEGDPTALYIYDENENLIVKDIDWHATQSTASWTPLWTGNFKVVVQNRQGQSIDYVLYTN
ncbi:MAG: hypothetical protein LBD04_04325 [Synergistaceae bacterium]|jgi:hypothetical protein|nr:hypothetical protein [Synergistaceae bacterium]